MSVISALISNVLTQEDMDVRSSIQDHPTPIPVLISALHHINLLLFTGIIDDFG